MLFDTHAHLNDARFDEDRAAVIDACRAAGIGGIVEIADAPHEWERAIALSRARPFVRSSLGLHPYHADQWSPAVGTELLRKAALPEVVAVGEIGLDYVKAEIGAEAQKRALEEMLARALDCGLPVVLHCRGAYEDLLPILERHYGGRSPAGRYHGVVHCFSGSREDARRSVELGFALGVDGPVTYPKNDALRAALKDAGLDALVLETDSPYLPPQSARGKRNDPRALPEIAAAVAALFGIAAEEVARRTTSNAYALYRLDAAGNKRH